MATDLEVGETRTSHRRSTPTVKGRPRSPKRSPASPKRQPKPARSSPKTKELIALAIGIAGRCDGCVGFHTQAAIRHGADRDGILETIGVAIYMGGGPSYVYGAAALQAFDQLQNG